MTTTTAIAATIRLEHSEPFDWPAMLNFFRARAIPGVEVVDGDHYARTIEIEGRAGTVEVRVAPDGGGLEARIRFAGSPPLEAIVARLRRVFDLDADPRAIASHLRADDRLRPLVDARLGLRVPGAWDGFEMAARAILGQQITVVGARQLAGKLVAEHGRAAEIDGQPGLTSLFPRPEMLAGVEVRLGMPGARARSLATLARAATEEPRLFEPTPDLESSVARLKELPGIGEWTAQYIALRALHHPDAFPAADVGLLRAMTPPGGPRPTPFALLARADAWRPFRAYAAQHLWASLGRPARFPPTDATARIPADDVDESEHRTSELAAGG
jgi:3-methyladenine DNA glycosylase/8-oxoguanine DNA glycosylase